MFVEGAQSKMTLEKCFGLLHGAGCHAFHLLGNVKTRRMVTVLFNSAQEFKQMVLKENMVCNEDVYWWFTWIRFCNWREKWITFLKDKSVNFKPSLISIFQECTSLGISRTIQFSRRRQTLKQNDAEAIWVEKKSISDPNWLPIGNGRQENGGVPDLFIF